MIFIKKPIPIEAFRLFEDEAPAWFIDRIISNEIIILDNYKNPTHCEIKTLEGVMRGNKGDWILKGVKGEIYPCKPDLFAETYDEVKE